MDSAVYFNGTHNLTRDQFILEKTSPPMSRVISIPLTIIYLILFVVGVMGNLITIIVLANTPRVARQVTSTNLTYYLLNLAVADLLLLIFGLPIETYHLWYSHPELGGRYFSSAVCYGRSFVTEMSTYNSVMTIVVFSMERYLAICLPIQAHVFTSPTRARKAIVVVWIVACVAAAVMASQFQIEYVVYENETFWETSMCMNPPERQLEHSFVISAIFFFFFPFIAIATIYTKIAITVKMSMKLLHSPITRDEDLHNFNASSGGQNTPIPTRKTSATTKPNTATTFQAVQPGDTMNNTQTNRLLGNTGLSTATTTFVTTQRKVSFRTKNNALEHKRRLAVIRMLVLVSISFFVCWTPFHLQRILSVIKLDPNSSMGKWNEAVEPFLFIISGVLYYISAVVNPFLYSLMSIKFRRGFTLAVKRWTLCPRLRKCLLATKLRYQSCRHEPDEHCAVGGNIVIVDDKYERYQQERDIRLIKLKKKLRTIQKMNNPNEQNINNANNSNNNNGSSDVNSNRDIPRNHDKQFLALSNGANIPTTPMAHSITPMESVTDVPKITVHHHMNGDSIECSNGKLTNGSTNHTPSPSPIALHLTVNSFKSKSDSDVHNYSKRSASP